MAVVWMIQFDCFPLFVECDDPVLETWLWKYDIINISAIKKSNLHLLFDYVRGVTISFKRKQNCHLPLLLINIAFTLPKYDDVRRPFVVIVITLCMFGLQGTVPHFRNTTTVFKLFLIFARIIMRIVYVHLQRARKNIIKRLQNNLHIISAFHNESSQRAISRV